MKKFLSLLTVLAFALNVSAQKIAFLERTDYASLPDEGEEHPEKNARDWFNTNYVATGKGEFISSSVSSIDPATYPVLWVNVDAVGLANLAAAGIDNDVIEAIKTYVQAGGNLFLTKQASTLAYSIGRINYAPQWANGGYENRGQMQINPHLGIAVSEQNRSSHAVFKNLTSVNTTTNGHTYSVYPLSEGFTTDNNNNFEPMKRRDGTTQNNGENNKLTNFEDDWNCQVLATWGQVLDFCVPGLMEFFPEGDFKGTIIVNGFAAYQWGASNTQKSNVEKLTANILDYLSKRATATWTTAPKANPVIKDEEDVVVTPSTNCTVTVTTSDPNIANYNEGHIYYNFFGNVTFTATATGDGVNIPKNAVLYPEVRTVTGGAPAAFGYILPSSIHIISANGYNGDGNYLPDYLAALWFYNEYVSQGTGCFINPAEASIPSQVKVLWINSDKNGLSTENFDAAYASTEFVTTLTNFYNAGGNLLLTKQAVRMLRKLGRYDNGTYPTYANGGYTDNNYDWNIRNSFFAGDGAVDYSSHLIFKELSSPFTLIAGDHNHRTDNNNLIYNEVFDDKAAMQSFESTHNCRILGTWPNADNNKCDRGVLVEFLPQSATAGTIIEVGASAYQWNDKGTINLENVHQNMKKLTSNILSYLYSLTTYTRTVTNGNYGTICLPRASESTSGATFYIAVGKILDGSSNPSDVVIEEVAALEAGVPYIFQASAEEITVNYTGAATAAPKNTGTNGLIGSFIKAPIADNSNYYILHENKLRPQNGGSNFVGENRAYFDLGNMSVYDPSSPATAPRKRMGVNAPHVATGIEDVQGDNVQCTKVIENGQLFILRDGVKYNVQGQIIQ